MVTNELPSTPSPDDGDDTLVVSAVRSPSLVISSIHSMFVVGFGAMAMVVVWQEFVHSTKRFDPVRVKAVTDHHVDPVGWVLGATIVIAVVAMLAAMWWRADWIDATGITRRRLRSRQVVAWSEISEARVLAGEKVWALAVGAPTGPMVVRLPDRRRLDLLLAIQGQLDESGGPAAVVVPGADLAPAPLSGPHEPATIGTDADVRGPVELQLPTVDDDTHIGTRRTVRDLEVALGRAPSTTPRPRWTRRDIGRALPALALVLAAGGLRIWISIESGDDRRPPTTIDTDAIASALGQEPDLSTIDADARGRAERALTALAGPTATIDCDGPIPTRGGLGGVRYVAVRTPTTVWESTPVVAPGSGSDTWRLADLRASGAFASTTPLPAPVARLELQVHTYLGPAWFRCAPPSPG